MTSAGELALGIDVGGTRVKAGLVDDAGQVVATQGRWTPGLSTEPAAVESVIVEVAGALLAQAASSGRTVCAAGVGAAGLVDAARGEVVFAPHLSWREEPLQERLRARLEVPVFVDNDANAAAWAEYRFGAGTGEPYLVMLTLGTGIGGAILTDGVVQRGRSGLAGEFGHQQVVPDGRRCECGNRGCWEQYASGSVLRKRGQQIVRAGGHRAAALDTWCGGEVDRLEGWHVTQAARSGDPASLAVMGEVGHWLGVGLAGVVAALDPGTVVLGGGVSEAGELLLAPARAALTARLVGRGYRPVPAVVAARLGVDAGLVGAADLARSRVGPASEAR